MSRKLDATCDDGVRFSTETSSKRSFTNFLSDNESANIVAWKLLVHRDTRSQSLLTRFRKPAPRLHSRLTMPAPAWSERAIEERAPTSESRDLRTRASAKKKAHAAHIYQ